jgi:hypothetical protein
MSAWPGFNPQGLKPNSFCLAVSARLKSWPDTKPELSGGISDNGVNGKVLEG